MVVTIPLEVQFAHILSNLLISAPLAEAFKANLTTPTNMFLHIPSKPSYVW